MLNVLTDTAFYSFDDYKAILKEKLRENQSQRGYQTRLAEAAGCQKSFFSQVLNSHVHLTLDHAANLCEFWDFDSERTYYFLSLVIQARAASPALRRVAADRVSQIRKEKLQVHRAFDESVELKVSDQGEFYTKWYMSATCMLLDLPGYRRPEKIAERLRLPVSVVEYALERLVQMGLVKKTSTGYARYRGHIFTRETPFRSAYLTNWRTIGTVRSQRPPDDRSLHTSILYTLPKSAPNEMRRRILELVKQGNDYEAGSGFEELYCLNVDFFSV